MINNFKIPDISSSLMAAQMKVEAGKLGYADVMYKRIMYQIGAFEKELNTDEEVGAYLASFGKEIIIQIEDVGYHNPYFIIFYGINTIDGSKVKLVQHVSQINILFIAVKIKEEREAHRIGFQIEEKESPNEQDEK